MWENVSKAKFYQIAAWYSFLGPLAGAVCFLVAAKAELEWLAPALMASLLLAVFSSGLAFALATVFGSRCSVPRPVKEIGCLGTVVSGLLLFFLVTMLVCSH